jgi:hypothetical protein
MRINNFLVAEDAIRNPNGKSDYFGVGRQWESDTFPFEPNLMTIVVELGGSDYEFGEEQNIVLKLLDEDAKPIYETNTGGVFVKGAEGMVDASLAIFFQMTHGVVFNTPGIYTWVVEINEQLMDRSAIVDVRKSQ